MNGIATLDDFNSFKNNFTTNLRLVKNYNFKRKFTDCSNNSRDTGKSLNSLMAPSKPPKQQWLLGQWPSIIAEVFNNCFSNVTSNLDHNFPHSSIFPLSFLLAPAPLPPSESKESVNLIPRQKKKYTDLINIPVIRDQILAPLIFPTVSMLFNNSLSEGILPECFKIAKITPILKHGYRNSTRIWVYNQKQLLNFVIVVIYH